MCHLQVYIALFWLLPNLPSENFLSNLPIYYLAFKKFNGKRGGKHYFGIREMLVGKVLLLRLGEEGGKKGYGAFKEKAPEFLGEK